MPDNSKFSNFASGGVLDSDDIVVGLRSGVNTKFTYNGGLAPSVVVPIDQGGTGATNAAEARTNLGLEIGSDVQAWDANLDGLSALASTGFVAQTASGTFADRVIGGTSNEIDVTNGNGIAGDPVLRLSSTIDAPGTLTIQSTVAIDSIIDDDSMSTASDTNISTSEAIKAYIDAVAGGGFTVILTCLLGTTANLSGTYDNGTAGVGATLTNNTTQAALELDGVTVQVNDRVLVKDQTSTEENGVYTVTTVGDGSTDWVLTRATDYDTAAEIIPGTLIPISSGDTLGGSIWIESATVTTVGTDPIVFNIFAQPANTFVTLATNQIITGDKTFSGTVTVPTPTTDFEAATKAYVDANGGGGGNVGDIVDFAGTSAPSGCLVCDGSAVSRATYSALFSVIGTTWGIGDGTTTFNLPDASRLTTVGSGGSATATLGNAVGDTGGTETNTLTTDEMPSRSIYYATSSLTNHIGSNTGAAGYYPATSAATWNSGGGQAQNNMQPSMVVLRCIRYEPVATSTATAADQTAQEAASSSVVFTNPASQQFHPSSCKAWVVFNGVGTVAISASYNVTSITDNGTGDYTVNFTNAFSSINYSASGSCGFGSNPSYPSATVSYIGGPHAVPTASAWRFGTGQGAVSAEAGVRVDLPYISMQFFGELA